MNMKVLLTIFKDKHEYHVVRQCRISNDSSTGTRVFCLDFLEFSYLIYFTLRRCSIFRKVMWSLCLQRQFYQLCRYCKFCHHSHTQWFFCAYNHPWMKPSLENESLNYISFLIKENIIRLGTMKNLKVSFLWEPVYFIKYYI